MYSNKIKAFTRAGQALATIALLGVAAAAQADLIDFDNDLPTVAGLSSWSQANYTVSSNVPSGTLVDTNSLVRAAIGAPGTGNNTQSIFWGANGATSTLTVTHDLGYGFDLVSFDASSLYNPAGSLTVTGYQANGGIVSQTVALDSNLSLINIVGMTGLYQLEFSFDGATQFAPYDLDNISLNLVPVPAAVWLMGSALGLLAAARRRRAA